MKTLLTSIGHIMAVIILTIISQIGGIVWIINFGAYKMVGIRQPIWLKLISFILLYIIFSLIIVPPLSKLDGRVALPISKSADLIPHNYFIPFCNRHYVKSSLRDQLFNVATKAHSKNPKLKLTYLDANFPFLDGFPLLPHLSHDDGLKVDLSFYYTKDKKEGNLKPSNSGYGFFVEPNEFEYDQINECKSGGYWQYDYTKYLTFGSRSDLEFDLNNTKSLILELLKNRISQKLFIEPHLKKRMHLTDPKIRFQGCRAVRHDDHIHYQINP